MQLLARRFPHRGRLSDQLTVPGRTVRAHVLRNLLEYLPEQEHQEMAGVQLEQPLVLGKVGQARLLTEEDRFLGRGDRPVDLVVAYVPIVDGEVDLLAARARIHMH